VKIAPRQQAIAALAQHIAAHWNAALEADGTPYLDWQVHGAEAHKLLLWPISWHGEQLGHARHKLVLRLHMRGQATRDPILALERVRVTILVLNGPWIHLAVNCHATKHAGAISVRSTAINACKLIFFAVVVATHAAIPKTTAK
jgi:hypothetical protein